MSDTPSSPDRTPLQIACELVGRFQYHFSKIEAALNKGISKVLTLNDGATQIVCANLDFLKKVSIIKSAVALQFEDKDKALRKLLDKIAGLNNPDRQTVIHSTFEPNGDGVRFVRVTTRDELSKDTIEWDATKFDQTFKRMDLLANQLLELVENLKPYEPSLDFSDPRNSQYLTVLL